MTVLYNGLKSTEARMGKNVSVKTEDAAQQQFRYIFEPAADDVDVDWVLVDREKLKTLVNGDEQWRTVTPKITDTVHLAAEDAGYTVSK